MTTALRAEPPKPQYSGIASVAGGNLILADEGVEPAPILVAAKADNLEKTAAAELAKYLSKISGAEFTVATAGEALPERAVIVGPIDGLTLPDGITDEGYVIRADGKRLYLCGARPQSTMYAVYGLLEEQLGCKWWTRDAEYVPTSRKIQVASQDTHIEPAFRMHNVFNREAQNGENNFRYKRRTLSITDFTGGHTICPMLQPYAEKNPEFLPTNDKGERAFNNLHMNYTAAGMSEALAEAMSKEVEKRQGNVRDYIYFAGMGDWYGGMDMSPESKAIYEEETWTDPDGQKKPGYIATLLRMMNKTAAILDKKYPGITIGTFAYMSLEAPPAKTKPADNLAIWIPRLRHDTVQSILESEGNRSYQRNLDRWAELAPGRVYIWEYGANFTNFTWPFPSLRSMAANIKYYQKIGVSGVMIQGNYVSTGGDMAVLKNYVWSKMMWDASLDPNALVREFCEGYYGPAAPEISAWVNMVEDSVRGEKPISADEFNTAFPWMTPDLIANGRKLFARALAKTGGENDPLHKRVKEAEASLESFLLWRDGPLKEVGEELVRTDFDAPTLPRVRELVSNLRGAGPREWGGGRSYQMQLLSAHGGPMPILKAGNVTVKVAPLQGGQIRSVLLGDTVAIDSSANQFRGDLYEMTKREGNRVVMETETGIAHWSPQTKQIGVRTVELSADGVLKTVEAVKKATAGGAIAGVIETVYQVGDAPEQVLVEYQAADGTWTAAKVTAQAPKAELPVASRLRITRQDRKVVIDDRYSGPNPVTGSVEYDPKAKVLKTLVSYGPFEKYDDKSAAEYGQREIRVSRL